MAFETKCFDVTILDEVKPKGLNLALAGRVAVFQALGYSQAETALRTGISQPEVSRYRKRIRALVELAPSVSPSKLLLDLMIRGMGPEAVGAIFATTQGVTDSLVGAQTLRAPKPGR